MARSQEKPEIGASRVMKSSLLKDVVIVGPVLRGVKSSAAVGVLLGGSLLDRASLAETGPGMAGLLAVRGTFVAVELSCAMVRFGPRDEQQAEPRSSICARSSTGQSNGLRNRRLGVRIPPGVILPIFA